jgi:hypothetical protein
MGRLTLNVLLSFAQFEREVIGERIRDKISASKKKGMWTGGVPPLGYRVHDRKLVITDNEGGNRSEDLPPVCRTRLGPIIEGRARSRGDYEQVPDERFRAPLARASRSRAVRST